VNEQKEDVSAVGDVNVRRRLAQFDAGDRRSLGQRAAVAVVLRQNPLQLVNKLLLHGTNQHSGCRPLERVTVFIYHLSQKHVISEMFVPGQLLNTVRKKLTQTQRGQKKASAVREDLP